jgi:inward rectifier potassium channel
MRNRWFHPPHLHTPHEDPEKRATWLELFYDLIFVAAFIQLGDGLSNKASLEGFAQFMGVFLCLWIAWTGFTVFVNRFTIDDFVHRLLVFVQMFSVGAMAVTAELVLEGDPYYFAGAYAIAQAMVAILYWRTWRQVPEARAASRYWGTVYTIGAVLWAASLLLPTPICYALWPIGVLVILSAPFSRQSRALQQLFPTDQEHLSERYGLLTLIVLGESFVKVLSSLRGGAEGTALLQMSFTLLITCCVWWVYFDDVAGSKVKRKKLTNMVWLYAHLPLQASVTATGVAIKKAVHFDLSVPAPDAYRWLLSGTLGLVMLSVAIIDSVTERRQAELSDRARVNVRSASALLIFLLAPAGGSMTAATYMVLVTAVCVAQVVFDMMMAPFEDTVPVESVTTAELARRQADGEITAREARGPRRSIGEAIRKGTPSELRRDLYFYFMEGSWKRYFVVLAFLYVMVNVFFAALFALQPGCIDGANPESFADAFFFSIQTFSTIGFGALSPATEYADIIVTAEAGVGMLFVALATGLTFAKASRPRASALFSKVMVITKRHGVPTLVFRVGNARGNDVVDATITVTVLADEITPEGEHMRRLSELKLVRDRTPLFALSWTVMHVIDEDSPLYGIDWDRPDETLIAFIATLIGHDGTYGQTVYARHNYDCDDLRYGQRFVDVISQLPDGRLMIDYDKFHDTEPIEMS